MPIVRQADFTGGEVDPRLWGKTTHAKYPTFVRRMSNFFAVPQGAALNRPGTVFVGLTRDQTAAPKLIPFLRPSQNYLLEVSAGNIRVWANGVFVVDVPAAAITAGMIDRLKYSQNEADLILTYGGQGAESAAMAPQQLRRVSHAVCTFGVANFAPPPTVSWAFAMVDAGGSSTTHPAGLPDPAHAAIQWDWAFTFTLRNIATGEVAESGIVSRFGD